MLKKRIVVCLDVKDGRTTKGVKFKDNIDIGDPVEMAAEYYRQGVDELVFYDIMASTRGRGPILELISRVASQVFIPFCVGGGIGTLDDIRSTILAGAEKISLNSQAVKNPELIRQGARVFGNQCIVLGMDAAADAAMPSGYRIYINGGRTATGLDALDWAQQAVSLGSGEIVLNSIDADGTKAGFAKRRDLYGTSGAAAAKLYCQRPGKHQRAFHGKARLRLRRREKRTAAFHLGGQPAIF